MGNCLRTSASSSSAPAQLQRQDTVKDLENASTQLQHARDNHKGPLNGLSKLSNNTNAMLEQARARITMRRSGGDTDGAAHETGVSDRDLVNHLEQLTSRWRG